jgi:hypothetical protein
MLPKSLSCKPACRTGGTPGPAGKQRLGSIASCKVGICGTAGIDTVGGGGGGGTGTVGTAMGGALTGGSGRRSCASASISHPNNASAAAVPRKARLYMAVFPNGVPYCKPREPSRGGGHCPDGLPSRPGLLADLIIQKWGRTVELSARRAVHVGVQRSDKSFVDDKTEEMRQMQMSVALLDLRHLG